jgi:DNA-directed RNA polymerase subunit beta'
MLAPNNIFSPSSGKPITTPSQDIVLGCYYLTQNPRKNAQQNERLRLFSDPSEIEYALSENAVKIHEKIRFKNPDFGQKTIFGNSDLKVIETTAGRVIFNGIWPRELGFFNRVAAKKQLSDIIWRTYQVSAQQKTVETLDRLKEIDF